MSQNPSAAEAMMGPKMRETAKVRARVPKRPAHGSNVRPVLQASLAQSAATDWARIRLLTSMARIMPTAKTAT